MKLIWIHLFNSVLLAFIGVPLLIDNVNLSVSDSIVLELDSAAFSIVVIYLQLFILFIERKFVRKMQDTNMIDHVLGKQVPFAVFIHNFRIYKQYPIG